MSPDPALHRSMNVSPIPQNPLEHPWLALRQSFERYVDLPDPVWTRLRGIWDARQIRKGEHLTEEGEQERSFYVVLDGVHRVCFFTSQGTDVTVAFAYAGDYSGIPDSLLLEKPSTHALVAVTSGRVLETSHEQLRRVMNASPVLDRWAWRLLAASLRGRALRERRHLSMTAAERYQRFVEDSGHLLQHVPLKHIASYLGMTPETLSRVRR